MQPKHPVLVLQIGSLEYLLTSFSPSDIYLRGWARFISYTTFSQERSVTGLIPNTLVSANIYKLDYSNFGGLTIIRVIIPMTVSEGHYGTFPISMSQRIPDCSGFLICFFVTKFIFNFGAILSVLLLFIVFARDRRMASHARVIPTGITATEADCLRGGAFFLCLLAYAESCDWGEYCMGSLILL